MFSLVLPSGFVVNGSNFASDLVVRAIRIVKFNVNCGLGSPITDIRSKLEKSYCSSNNMDPSVKKLNLQLSL